MTTPDDFRAIKIITLDLGQPLPDIDAGLADNGQPYGQAFGLLRANAKPFAVTTIELDANGQTPAESYGPPLLNQFAAELAAAPPAGSYPPPPPADSPFISVVIPTHERAELLPACLNSLLALNYPNFEVIVVDNAPRTDATRTVVEEHFAGRVRYVLEPRKGLNYARNAGALAAKGEIFVLVDDDVAVDSYWLAAIAQAFQQFPNVGCVTGVLLPAELETPAQLWFEQYGGFIRGFQQKVYDLQANRPASPFFPYTVGMVGTGATMAFRTATYKSVGMCDVVMGVGTLTGAGDDLDIFFRILKHGYQIVYQPESLAWHTHRRDFPGLKRQMYNYGLGFTTFITKSLLTHPADIFAFLWRLPKGIWLLLSPKSVHNEKKTTYPAELTRIEWLGMFRGPFLYIWSVIAFQFKAGPK